MSRDVMRWRLAGETPFYPWVMSRVFMGDLVLIRENDFTRCWQYNDRLAGMKDMIVGGVAMYGGKKDQADQVRVAMTGGFEFPFDGPTPAVGDFVSPAGPTSVQKSIKTGSIGTVYHVYPETRTVRFTLHGTEVFWERNGLSEDV